MPCKLELVGLDVWVCAYARALSVAKYFKQVIIWFFLPLLMLFHFLNAVNWLCEGSWSTHTHKPNKFASIYSKVFTFLVIACLLIYFFVLFFVFVFIWFCWYVTIIPNLPLLVCGGWYMNIANLYKWPQFIFDTKF